MNTSKSLYRLIAVYLGRQKELDVDHYVKGVHIQIYSGPYFLAFGLNTERYSVGFRFQSECGKILTRITPNRDTCHAMDL